MMTHQTILLIEDDDNDVVLLNHAFQEAGIPNPLYVLKDGQQALDYFSGQGVYGDRRLHPLPCLVLLDLKLPLRSGLEVLGWVRSQPSLRSTVVILLTAASQPEDVPLAYELGVNSFIVKPSDIESRKEMALLLKGWWLKFNPY
jgi:CheY-like chemotaxis protein